MRNLVYLLCLFTIIGCGNSGKMVYWCGDHPCVNKKERKAYFEKNMTVEVKNLNKSKISSSEIARITKEAKLKEKKRIKTKKESDKQARIDEKNKIKEEKRLKKIARKEEKKKIKSEKKLTKINKNKVEEKSLNNKELISLKVTDFEKIAEAIIKRNENKPYPDINNLPN